jgi:hypothetical protein
MGADVAEQLDAQGVTGYDSHDRYFASRYPQGGRIVHSIDLSLAAVAALLPRPDPDRPTPGNRRVKLSHARGFARYLRDNEDWVAPSLILRSPDIFQFEQRLEVAGTRFGVISLPKLARTDLRILDGQHRILGIYIAVEDIARELEEQRNLLSTAKKNGDTAAVHELERAIKDLERQRERLGTERISVQIVLEDDQEAYEQMFVDIADNALGISSAIRARFDSRKIVNRCLEDVLRHALLKDKVDMYQDRVGGPSPNLMGAKHVADVIRTVTVGIGGRIGRRQEEEFHESALVEATNDFLDVLISAFPELEKVADGSMKPEELRKQSLLGSTTMLRVLAGVFYELRKDVDDEAIEEFFARLDGVMEAPVEANSPWFESGVFSEGAMAPKARGGDMKILTSKIVQWHRDNPDWLED